MGTKWSYLILSLAYWNDGMKTNGQNNKSAGVLKRADILKYIGFL
jgi:hypothetical protein